MRPAAAAPPRRPEQVEMRRAGFFGHHPPRDKEHQLASRKCRRESTPQTSAADLARGVLCTSTPLLAPRRRRPPHDRWIIRADRPSSSVRPQPDFVKWNRRRRPAAGSAGPGGSTRRLQRGRYRAFPADPCRRSLGDRGRAWDGTVPRVFKIAQTVFSRPHSLQFRGLMDGGQYGRSPDRWCASLLSVAQ